MKVTVTYAAGPQQEHPGLTVEQVAQCVGEGAFVGDMMRLRGAGVTKVVVELEESDR